MADPQQKLLTRTAQVDESVIGRFPPLEGVALAAVGGYGRRELFPHSDIDLLFLAADDNVRAGLKEPLAPFLRELWDSGLRISQSVHTPAECAQFDSQNVELFISLLDRRFLTGDRSVYERLVLPKSRTDLVSHLTRLTRERHANFQNTIYHLEPHIKDGPGGLRDLQVIRWLHQLTGTAQNEDLAAARDFLFDLRWRMHEIARRDNNVLDFATQDQVDRDDPSRLMRTYFRAARPLFRACGNLLEANETRSSGLLARFRDRTARLSNADFTVIRERVFFRSPQQAVADPALVERLFVFVARHGVPLAADTQDRLLAHRPEMHTQWPVLREILSLPHVDLALREMNETRVLPAIFPEFAHVESLVVRDFYHRYTVDEHILVAIRTLAQLKRKPDTGFPNLIAEAPPLAILYLALLFHDAGKGTGQDHTLASVRLARGMFDRIGLPQADRDTVVFLIERHLQMSAAMTSRDISDPAVANEIAKYIGTVERLKYLTLLTYADISAVNPEAMTTWRSTLLWNLYTSVYRALTSELDTGRLEARSYGSPEREYFLDGLPVRYLRTHSEEDIARHMEMSKEEEAAVRLVREKDVFKMTVVTSDRPFLFASIAGALASFGMNIVNAEAFGNRHGIVVDTFYFVDPLRTLELNPGEDAVLINTVRRTVRGDLKVETLLKRRPVRTPASQHMQFEPIVAVDNTASDTATLLEITAEDRPGLLYQIAASISAAQCNIEVVLIDTRAHRALDVFYITRDGGKLPAPDAEALAASLKAAVTEPRA
jgi:[protein-PII] uridylyltransferase